MKVRVARSDIYVPKWRDNRELPEAEQIKVHFNYMTAVQEEQYSMFKPKYVGEGKEVDFDFELNATDVWKECVTKIEGLIDEKDKPITSPTAALAVPGIYGLVTEVVGHIRQGLDGVDRKNS